MAHVTPPKHLANPQEQRESERRARQAELNRRFAAAQEAAKAGNFATILVVTAIFVILAVIIVIVRIVAMIVMINSKNDSHTHTARCRTLLRGLVTLRRRKIAAVCLSEAGQHANLTSG